MQVSEGVKPLIVYHADCADGFTAAWVAWRVFGSEAEYLSRSYGDLPVIVAAGQEVFFLDFSYPPDVMCELIAAGARVTILDHHETAVRDLALFSLPGVLDVTKSGAMLAWEWFFRELPPTQWLVPKLVMYVQDRDLWRWELSYSRAVSAWLRTVEYDFDEWTMAADVLERDFSFVCSSGAALLKALAREVERSCARARLGWPGGRPAAQSAGNQVVPIVNATSYASEVGEALLVEHPTAPFVSVWYEGRDGRRIWSVRSRGDFDVSAVARALGGGGHKAAAGWSGA